MQIERENTTTTRKYAADETRYAFMRATYTVDVQGSATREISADVDVRGAIMLGWLNTKGSTKLLDEEGS